MKKYIRTIFRLSRPPFWLYLAGPYLLGVTLATSTLTLFTTFQFWYPFFYFLIPANIILYGINDISDQDTDRFNDKKQQKELLYTKKISAVYMNGIGLSICLTIPLFFLFQEVSERALLVLFFFLVLGYSLSPLRLKKRPGVDSSSNILYIIPGILGYLSNTASFPSSIIIIAACSWAIAMHLFSAIPDISSDTKAKLKTSAMVLGKRNSLLVCCLLWSISVFSIARTYPVFIIFSLYPLLPVVLLNASDETIKRVYWYFPIITSIYGAMLWLLISLKFL